MLKLSTRSRYGIWALIELSLHEKGTAVPAAVISDRRKIPRVYLEQILHRLNRAGIVESVRGPAGGYRMKKTADRLSLGEIVGALEARRTPLFCLGTAPAGESCAKAGDCFSQFICRGLDRQFDRTLERITLKKIAKEWSRNEKKKNIS